MKMKAVVIREIGSYELADVEVPSPGRDEVLIRVSVAGLCRTDLKIIEVGHRDLTLPRIPAEEVVGRICEIGPNLDSSWIDKHVYVYPGTSCGACIACRKGAGNLCSSMQIMGFHRDGGFAEYVLAPVKSVIEVPDNTPFDLAVFAEPLSCCLNALEMARLSKGDTVGIWGAGPAGTLLARAAAALGGNPVVIETDERRRALIQGVASVPDAEFDIVIPAVGAKAAYREALDHMAPRGRLVCFSGLSSDQSSAGMDLNQLHYREQCIVGAYGCSYRHGKQALQLISSRDIKVEDMISHRLPLAKLEEGLEHVRHRTGMKILLYPGKDIT